MPEAKGNVPLRPVSRTIDIVHAHLLGRWRSHASSNILGRVFPMLSGRTLVLRVDLVPGLELPANHRLATALNADSLSFLKEPTIYMAYPSHRSLLWALCSDLVA